MASVIKTRSREPNSAMKDGAASHEARRFEGAGNALTAKHSRFLADTFQPLLNIQGLRLILPQAPEDAELGLWDTLKLHWHPLACRSRRRKTSRVNSFSRGSCL